MGVKLCKRGHERTPENVDSSNHCKLCRVERTKRNSRANVERVKVWRELNPEKVKDQARKIRATDKNKQTMLTWRAANPERIKKSKKKAISNMPDAYIANTLGMSVRTVQPQLIELKRKQLSLIRFVREAKQAKENRNGNIPCNA